MIHNRTNRITTNLAILILVIIFIAHIIRVPLLAYAICKNFNKSNVS